MPIANHPLMATINTGIELDHLPGCIPVYYEVEACNAANYKYYDDWQELKVSQRHFLIAHYYMTKTIAAHQSDAEYREMKRKQRKGVK